MIEIEAEHLHNIPSLIDEENIQRHLYYFNKERPAYIEALKELDLPEYTEPVLRIYLMPWDAILESLGENRSEGDGGKEEVEQAVGGNGGQAP